MKTLLLMRHAKSSWKHPDMKDIERPLNKRGEKDAPRMGKLLLEQELVPQLILCSSAVRARKTVEAVVEKSGYRGEVMYLDSFYLAEPSVYLDVLRVLPDNLERVMLVGHNPGLEAVLQMLSGRVESLPTAAIAYISLAIEHWNQVEEDSKGELVQLWRPRDI
jgi:phosphohistidine phosphatase